MQSAPFGGFFLINALFLAYASDSTTESDADIWGHCPASCGAPADAYTADESQSS